MKIPNKYSGLKFESFTLPSRPIIVIISAIVFTVAWRTMSHSTLFWLGLPAFVILVWLASYGWRPALFRIINFLDQLTNI